MRGGVDRPCNKQPCRVFLLLMTLVVFPSMVMATTESNLRHVQRQLEDFAIEELTLEELAQEDLPQEEPSLPVGAFPSADNNGDGVAYNPCNLCQGLPMLSDKIANPMFFENLTCGEIAAGYEYQPSLMGTSSDSCRGDLGFNAAFEACCRPSIPYYECEQNVHKYIDEQDYNTAVPPILGFEPNEKLNVTVRIIYQAIEDIAVEEGTATIFVTMYMKWNDPRLAWDIEDNDTCSNMVLTWTGHEVEKAKIWVPDFQLLNEIDGMQTMPEYKAHVYADGTVLWNVNGGLKAFCAYRGLAKIPFDVLGCQMIFGGASREHSQLISYTLEDPDYLTYGAFEVTYNEWVVVPEMGQQGTLWDQAIYYNIFFKRATMHYIQNIVIPTIILTYLSFFTFLLDFRVGERLGFGMALALVVVAQQIVTSGMTPISDQRLWLDKFVAWSFYWVLIGVVESVFIGFLVFIREDTEDENDATEEELKPLAMEVDETLEPMTMEAGISMEAAGALRKEEETPRVTSALEASKEKTIAKDNPVKALYKHVVYKYPLRKLDMISLAASVATYTMFIIIMFSTGGASDVWLRDEPFWFDENTTPLDLQSAYVNNDPNN